VLEFSSGSREITGGALLGASMGKYWGITNKRNEDQWGRGILIAFCRTRGVGELHVCVSSCLKWKYTYFTT